MHHVFIDGQEGTTGLQIHERLRRRSDVSILEIDPERRKDVGARRALVARADVVITCLPDAAAKETAALAIEAGKRVIDPSTAHRTASNWVYGFPELDAGQRARIRSSARVSVPGCHATGFVAALYPLVSRGLVSRDYPVVAHSLSGYSGGGKKLIAAHEQAPDRSRLAGPRPYALALTHKHVPEMQHVVGLAAPPLFEPVVGDFYKGMLVSIPLFTRLLPQKLTPADVHEVLARHYEGERFVRMMPLGGDGALENGYLNPLDCNDTNRLDLFVFGHAEQILIVARLDNLGKGASGAAVQNMNLMLGVEEATGLE